MLPSLAQSVAAVKKNHIKVKKKNVFPVLLLMNSRFLKFARR